MEQPAEGCNTQRITTHPGQVLREDFLRPMRTTANAFAARTKMPATRVGEILHRRRCVAIDTALRLARFFGTSADFWLNLQSVYDLSTARMELASTIQSEVEPIALGGMVSKQI